ncbi:Holliday junction resolvase RuvX, partial [Streptomyces sp. NPDC058953]|uniref:Holliday junction resolvase RuvX n=1 Tax=Streptomyces sp. NPDC058953 TaxID=3346676 RepID=UPI0036953BA2
SPTPRRGAPPTGVPPVGAGQPPPAHRRLRALVGEYVPREVVVGLPRSLSGREGPAAGKARTFARELARGIAPVPVRLVDERMTTVTAGQGLRAAGVTAKKGRSFIDQAAAVVIPGCDKQLPSPPTPVERGGAGGGGCV